MANQMNIVEIFNSEKINGYLVSFIHTHININPDVVRWDIDGSNIYVQYNTYQVEMIDYCSNGISKEVVNNITNYLDCNINILDFIVHTMTSKKLD
jgi:hypothetical protein